MEVESAIISEESSVLDDTLRPAHKKRRFDRRRRDKPNKLPYDRSSYVYTPIPQENALFYEYYKGFNWMTSDEFENEFMASLRRPLPTTFRISGSSSQAQELRKYLLTNFVEPLTGLSRPSSTVQSASTNPVYTSSQLLSSQIPPPIPLPWYADDLAWQWNFSKNSLKKARQQQKESTVASEATDCTTLEKEEADIDKVDDSINKSTESEEDDKSKESPALDPINPELAALVQNFHSWLVGETQLGNISRQEAVSMLPPLILNVLPNDRVLDLCAAPGSKTSQLLESLHACAKQGDFMNVGTGGHGLVIGNDADAKRCYTLVHQVKRLSSPCCVITNYDAMNFPNFYLNDPLQPSNDTSSTSPSFALLQFDKVLCDVPCSGDGTMRKNPLIWRTWAPQQANGLHRMQYRILERGAQLAKVGAKIVYSTCSLNPVENEAVVATLLLKHPGCYRLLDESASLPGLKRRPGVCEWSVMTKINNDQYGRFTRYEDMPEEGKRKCLPTLFSTEEHRHLGLEACWRIFPQDQDTGGFFLAVIEKLAESHKKEERRKMDHMKNTNDGDKEKDKSDDDKDDKSDKEIESDQNEVTVTKVDDDKNNTKNGAKPPQRHHLFPRKGKTSAFKEEPFLPLTDKSEHLAEIESVLTFYNVSRDFPMHHLMVRSDVEKKKTYYYVSGTVHQLLTTPLSSQIRFVNTGVKLFARNEAKGDAPCVYRICQEGLRVILPFMTGRNCQSGMEKSRVLLVSAHTNIPAVRNVRALKGDGDTFNHCRNDINRLLSEGNVLFHQLESSELRQHLYAMQMGCVVLLLDLAEQGKEKDDALCVMERSVAIACWRGKASFSILAIKEERCSILKRFTDSALNVSHHHEV